MRRLLSLLALVAWAGGHALLFWSGVALQRSLDASSTGSVVAVPLAVGGAVLIGVAALTSAWSSLGTILIGAVATLAGLVAVAVPPGELDALNPVGEAVAAIGRLGDLGTAADLWLLGGACALEGVTFLVLGVAASRRRRGLVVEHPIAARVVALVVTVLGFGPSALLALHGGALEEQALYVRLGGPSVLGLVLLGVGLVLVAALATGTRWSGLGAIIAGALLFLATATAIVVPALLPATARASADYWDWRGTLEGLPREVQGSITQSVALGSLMVVAAVLLFGGIASAIAGRSARRLHRSNYIEPGTGEIEQQESPFGIFTP